MKYINEQILQSEVNNAFAHAQKVIQIRQHSKNLNIPIWFDGHLFFKWPNIFFWGVNCMGNKIVYRDAKGRFAKKENAVNFQKVENNKWEKIQKYEKEETYFSYTYLISFAYKKMGKHGRHDFYAEYIVVSGKELSHDEVENTVINADDEFANVLASCKTMMLKGVEIEEHNYETKTSVKQLRFHH